MHRIIVIEYNVHQCITLVSGTNIICYTECSDGDISITMRVLKTCNLRPLGIILIKIKINHHYFNLKLPQNSDSRKFKVGEKLPTLEKKALAAMFNTFLRGAAINQFI